MDRKIQITTRQNPLLYALATAAIGLLPIVAVAADDNAGNGVDAMALYNQGAAVVQERRELSLDKGDQQIAWPLTGQLRPDTLWLQGAGVKLTGFSAAATSNASGDPLAARIGQPVTLVRNNPAGGTIRREATLVGLHGESALVRIDDRIERITADAPWWLIWPADDADPAEATGLQLDVEAERAGTLALTATYQIDGPSWQASYTGRFDAKTGQLSLQGMAVINNAGGARLVADKAWLVAGDVARVGGLPQPMMMARSDARISESAPQAAGDTYRYALDGPLDVPANAVRAVAMTGPLSFKATRRYRFEHSAQAVSRDGTPRHAEVRLRLSNSADLPLPAGVVRVYNAQRTAGLMGEDRIGDTPAGAPVILSLGRAFDITGERRVVADEKTDAGQRTRTVEIDLHNAGARKASVDVIEHLPPAAQIVSASPKTKADSAANTGQWHIDVPSKGQATLRYTVQWPGPAD